MDVKVISALVVIGVAVLLDIIGLATPYWNYQSLFGSSVSTGLWKYCVTASTVSACADIDSLIPICK